MFKLLYAARSALYAAFKANASKWIAFNVSATFWNALIIVERYNAAA